MGLEKYLIGIADRSTSGSCAVTKSMLHVRNVINTSTAFNSPQLDIGLSLKKFWPTTTLARRVSGENT